MRKYACVDAHITPLISDWRMGRELMVSLFAGFSDVSSTNLCYIGFPKLRIGFKANLERFALIFVIFDDFLMF